MLRVRRPPPCCRAPSSLVQYLCDFVGNIVLHLSGAGCAPLLPNKPYYFILPLPSCSPPHNRTGQAPGMPPVARPSSAPLPRDPLCAHRPGCVHRPNHWRRRLTPSRQPHGRRRNGPARPALRRRRHAQGSAKRPSGAREPRRRSASRRRGRGRRRRHAVLRRCHRRGRPWALLRCATRGAVRG